MKNHRRSDSRTYNYNHPVFWSRKHPAYVVKDHDVREALVQWLHPSEPPF